MLSDAASSLRWIIDTLLKRHGETAQINNQKWVQVADYLDKIANLIDEALVDFRNNRIPRGHYSQLAEVGYGFREVLSQIYPKNSDLNHHYVRAYFSALHLIMYDVKDLRYLKTIELEEQPFCGEKQELLSDLEAAAGKFRGLAMTIRATS